MYSHGVNHHVWVLEEFYEGVSQAELYNVCSFPRRLKGAADEQNIHRAGLGWRMDKNE